MTYENETTKKQVQEEIKELQTVLNILTQLPKAQAQRIIQYCWRFLEDAGIKNSFDMEKYKEHFMEKLKEKLGNNKPFYKKD